MDQCLQNNVEATGIMPSGIAKWEKLDPGSDIKKKKKRNVPKGLRKQSHGTSSKDWGEMRSAHSLPLS